MVPLQDIPKSIAEADRAVNQLGARAVFMVSNVNGVYLDDARFDPLYEAVQDLGVPLFIHPAFPAALDAMGDYHLSNICGFPFDQTLNLGRMVLSSARPRLTDSPKRAASRDSSCRDIMLMPEPTSIMPHGTPPLFPAERPLLTP